MKVLFLVAFSLLLPALTQAQSAPKIESIQVSAVHEAAPEGPFVHTVFFWLKNPSSDADRRALHEGITGLSKIDLIDTAYIGVPAATSREVIDNSYDFSITFIFADKAVQDAYQTHPDHLKFVDNYAHLWERVIVYDAVPPQF